MEQAQWIDVRQRRRGVNWYIVGAIATGAALIALVALIVVSVVLPTEGMKEDAFADACYEDVRDQLRDPDSAHLESDGGVIYSDEQEQYTMLGDGRSRNGFGGMNNFIFGCTGDVDDSGNATVESDIMS